MEKRLPLRISLLSFRQGRVLVACACLACLGAVWWMQLDGDALHAALFSGGVLVLCLYWHFKGYYVSLDQNVVVLQKEGHTVKRPRAEVKDITSVSGFVYRLTFRDDTSYLFVHTPSFPFYKNVGRQPDVAKVLLQQVKER